MIPPLQYGQSPDPNSPIKTRGKNGDKTMFLSRKNAAIVAGGVILALTFCRSFTTASAQSGPTATPLPQVVLTQQAADNAAADVGNLQAERAQTQSRLDEINANIERQIAEATQAAADARNAAATQNAVEAGAAIGRLEGALAQLRESYAGKDSIISDLQSRLEQQAAQLAEQQRTIDKLTLDLQQAQRDKATTLNAYNALKSQQQTSAQNDMVSNAIWIVSVLALVSALILFGVFVIQRRRDAPDAPAAPEPIEGEYTVSDDNA
jgi:hypothetical protein